MLEEPDVVAVRAREGKLARVGREEPVLPELRVPDKPKAAA